MLGMRLEVSPQLYYHIVINNRHIFLVWFAGRQQSLFEFIVSAFSLGWSRTRESITQSHSRFQSNLFVFYTIGGKWFLGWCARAQTGAARAHALQLHSMRNNAHFSCSSFLFLEQGDLHSYVRVRKRLREPEAKRLFRQMCEVVKSCHEQGIVLRDLKLRKFVFADAER